MSTYKPINGYTKKEIIWYLKTFNDGNRCSSPSGGCAYKDKDNHCAIGCFIPHEHFGGMGFGGPVLSLLDMYPSLAKFMPLPLKALQQLQRTHDESFVGNTHETMIDWVETNVK